MTTALPKSIEIIRQSEPSEPKRISGTFIRWTYDVAKEIQKKPEMSDQEILIANQQAGGFAWLENPSEDIYNQ
jgi:hypothetical protein